MPISVPRACAPATASEIASRATSAKSTASDPGTGRGAGLLPRQHQQLLDQPRRAVDAGGQPVDRQLAAGIVAGALQQLHLQLERRQRRAQLVRGIGHEVLLRVEGVAHAVEQQVELVHQRPHLFG